jgi:methionyl-tRNA formyltransferase
LLPRWRGAAPVERALLAGDSETGVCLMQLEEGLDTGPVYNRVVVPIGPTATADDLRSELVQVGTRLLIEELTNGLDSPTPQDGEPTYAAKLRPDELRIDWTRSPVEIDRLVRLGGAWTTLGGKRLKIVAVELCAPSARPSNELRNGHVGGLRLTRVQPEGKAVMEFADFARGARLAEVEPLGITGDGGGA